MGNSIKSIQSIKSIPEFPNAITFLKNNGANVNSIRVFKYGTMADIVYKNTPFRFTHSLGYMEIRHMKTFTRNRRMSGIIHAMDRVCRGEPIATDVDNSIGVEMWSVDLSQDLCELRFNLYNIPLVEQTAKWNDIRKLMKSFSLNVSPLTDGHQVIAIVPDSAIEKINTRCMDIKSLNIALKWNDYRQRH